MQLVRDDIDFRKYLERPAEAARVLPASHWSQAVVDRLYRDREYRDCRLPWQRVSTKFQLRQCEVTLWSGVNGTGKSLVLNQVMLHAMQQGEKVCIASMEMRPEATLARMVRQAAGSREPSIPYVKAFHAWTDEKLWIFDHHGTVKRDIIIAVMRYVAEEIGVDHFVIDSLMKCGIGVDDYNSQKAFIDELCAWAKDYCAHLHLVCHSRKGESSKAKLDKFDIKGASEISDQADNVVLVWRNKPKEEEMQLPESERKHGIAEQADCLLTVDKQRHGEWEGKIALWYDADSMQYLENPQARAWALSFAHDAQTVCDPFIEHSGN